MDHLRHRGSSLGKWVLLLLTACPAPLHAAYSVYFETNPVHITLGNNMSNALAGAIADANNDGRNDVIVTAQDATSSDGYVFVYRQTGSTLTASPDIYATGGKAPSGLAVGDLNADGINDMAVANYQSSGVAVFLQNSTGSFSSRGRLESSSSGVGPRSLKIGDLNNDGRNDIAAIENSGTYPSTLTVYLQGSTGTYTSVYYPLHAGTFGAQVVLADLNNDGLKDVLIPLSTKGTSTGTVVAFVQNSSGTLSGPIRFQPSTSMTADALVAGAIDSGDGLTDFIALEGTTLFSIFPYLDGAVNPVTSYTASHNRGLVVTDVDGNGALDAVAVGNSGLGIFLQDTSLSSGPFHTQINMTHDTIGGDYSLPDRAAVGDINSDNRPDILFAGGQGSVAGARFIIALGLTGSASTGTVSGSTTTTVETPLGSIKAIDNLFDPSKGQSTTLQYENASGGLIAIRVFTLRGQLVRTLFRDVQTAGSHQLRWDGRNESGEMVASGIYLVHIEGPGFSKSQKIAVIR